MIYFIIPAYNEAENIVKLTHEIAAHLLSSQSKYEIVIIDDGSGDNTAEIIQNMSKSHPLICVKHETNKGVGQAFRTGFENVLPRASDDDIVITKEADNTSDPAIMKDMINGIQEGQDIILASCYAKAGGIEGTNFLRVFISSIANFLLRRFFPVQGVCTYSSFYRAYKVSILRKFFGTYGENAIKEDGFACMVEMLVKIHRITRKIKEVPMTLKGNLRKGKSKMRVIRTIADYLKLIVRLKFQFFVTAVRTGFGSATAEITPLDQTKPILKTPLLEHSQQSNIQIAETKKPKLPADSELLKTKDTKST